MIAENQQYQLATKTIKVLSEVDSKIRKGYWNCYVVNNKTGLSYFSQVSQALLLNSKLIKQ